MISKEGANQKVSQSNNINSEMHTHENIMHAAIRKFQVDAVDFASCFINDDNAKLASLFQAKRFSQDMLSLAEDKCKQPLLAVNSR